MALVCAGCSGKGSQTLARRSEAVPVSVARVVQKDVPLDIQVIGNAEAYSTVTIRSQVTGQLTHVFFSEGSYVRKNDLLFTLDRRPFEAQLNQAEANLQKDEAQLSQAEANLSRDIARQKYLQAQAARFGRLYQEGIASKDQSEQMQADADAGTQTVNADGALIRSAQAAAVASRAAVATARIQLGYTTIRSPIEGRTGNMPVKEGNLVTANVTDLMTINQVQPIYISFSVPEAHLPAIKEFSARGKLPVMALPQEGATVHETGDLTFVDNTVDAATGTIRLKGTFPNPSRKLWPGQFVRVVLRLTTQANSLVVPNQALQTGQEGTFVYLVKPDRTVEARPVVTGARMEQEIVVEKGLSAGDTVVTEGHLRLAPGTRVQIRGEGGRSKKGA